MYDLTKNTGLPKLTPKQAEALVKDYKEGMIQTELAKKYDIAVPTLRKYLRKADALPSQERQAKAIASAEDAVRKSITPSKAPSSLDSQDDTLMVSALSKKAISCEEKKQTYRENLKWAIRAAGTFSRTGCLPSICPNDIAFFLLQQALSQPKDFMAKVTQVEGRILNEEDEDATVKKNAKMSIADIEEQLQELKE